MDNYFSILDQIAFSFLKFQNFFLKQNLTIRTVLISSSTFARVYLFFLNIFKLCTVSFIFFSLCFLPCNLFFDRRYTISWKAKYTLRSSKNRTDRFLYFWFSLCSLWHWVLFSKDIVVTPKHTWTISIISKYSNTITESIRSKKIGSTKNIFDVLWRLDFSLLLDCILFVFLFLFLIITLYIVIDT